MGFLTDSAKKAYRKSSRRSHVPDWFMPAAYAFAGLTIVVVLVLAFLAEEPRDYNVQAPQPDEQIIGNDTTSDLPGDTADDTSTINTPQGPVPAEAERAGRTVAQAVFTGNFEQVTMYPGQPRPVTIGSARWTDPQVGQLTSSQRYNDSSLRLVYVVDPDGDGPERPREVAILMVNVDDTWTYLPG